MNDVTAVIFDGLGEHLTSPAPTPLAGWPPLHAAGSYPVPTAAPAAVDTPGWLAAAQQEVCSSACRLLAGVGPAALGVDR